MRNIYDDIIEICEIFCCDTNYINADTRCKEKWRTRAIVATELKRRNYTYDEIARVLKCGRQNVSHLVKQSKKIYMRDSVFPLDQVVNFLEEWTKSNERRIKNMNSVYDHDYSGELSDIIQKLRDIESKANYIAD